MTFPKVPEDADPKIVEEFMKTFSLKETAEKFDTAQSIIRYRLLRNGVDSTDYTKHYFKKKKGE
jgi:hypothetical protein